MLSRPTGYRLGLLIVAAAILLAGTFTLARVSPTPAPQPAGQDLGNGAYPLGSFRLTERSGRPITQADLASDIWVASFIFTRCPTSCPRITETVRGLQAGPLKGVPVRFVSISVDPEHDTPGVLSEYAKLRGADPDRWWFLTGDKASIYELILKRFHLPIAENPDPESKAEAVAHSDRLALVDRGNAVVGVFSSDDPEAIKALVAKIKARTTIVPPWVRSLPSINATLNGSCALLLAIGFGLIRSGHWRGHAVCMTLAVIVSAVFLGCYLLYHFQVGSVAFRGTGPIRFVYFTILISHTLLATFGVVPLVGLTVARVLHREWARHAAIARVTFPIWMYVSITGVVIYLMLYQIDLFPMAPAA